MSQDQRMRLEGWQHRLENHFSKLAATRREAGWPVFALEHGLGADDRAALIGDVRVCAAEGPARHTPLPWIVYAAEFGYEYSGYEYWQTFAARTPGWQETWRRLVRSRFEAFAEAYHGAAPEGDWARQFKNIAWPITHGILPKDLQRQLAALLYDARVSFRAETFASAESLGRHLQGRCDRCSSRFRQFAENTTLLGQIALALLLQHEVSESPYASGSTSVIHAPTLARIIEDLGRERDARDWLAEARTSASRFRVRGLGRIPLRTRDHAPDLRVSAAGQLTVARPRFVLREVAPDRWQVRVHFPNLAHLIARFPRARDVLARGQGRVAGQGGPLLARSRIISESWPAVVLSAWPSPEAPLLAFDGAPPELDAVLQSSFRLPPGDRWLFLIGVDGQARELSNRVLRPGESYLLLQRKEKRNTAVGIRTTDIAAEGVYALRIDVPQSVPDTLVSVLSMLGLEVAQTLEVWPAGLPAAEWTGDGRGEWVAGQPVMLGVRADRRMTHLNIALDGLPLVDVVLSPDLPLGEPLFVRLPVLQPGHHRLVFAARTVGGCEEPPEEDQRAFGLRGELECVIREPRSAARGAGALLLALHPETPSLEDVWEDRCEVHVAAPGAANIRCRVSLRSKGGQLQFGPRMVSLPSLTDSDAWRRLFAPVREAAEAQYDEAHLCVLEFDAGALGRARVTAERDFTPLRWVVREHGRYAVLIDSQGCHDLSVWSYSSAAPELAQPIDPATTAAGIEIGDEGALLVARCDDVEAATVVVPRQRVQTLAALGRRPQVGACRREAASIADLASLAAIWERARLTGSSLAESRRTEAVKALVARVISTIAGERWEPAEAQLRDRGPGGAADVMRGLVTNRPDERGVAAVLARDTAALAGAPQAEADQALVKAIQAFVKVPNVEELAPFALRLAASPESAIGLVRDPTGTVDPAEGRMRDLVEELLTHPIVVRAARYFLVATRATLPIDHREVRGLPWSS
ncbi:hypothetical protein [Longimicrobium sp.]|uniref:hypothetical protein n=1 Tax=Longimicrobium sp. TaxID=2029185 RepID=UPI003B3A25FD